MSYLLTNGIITDNLELYIRDLMFLNFKIYPTELPYNTELGIDRRIHEVSMSDFTDLVRINITDFLTKLNKRHNLRLNLRSMEVTPARIDLVITLSELEELEYSMPITN